MLESNKLVFHKLHLPLPVTKIFLPNLSFFSKRITLPYLLSLKADIIPEAPAPITHYFI